MKVATEEDIKWQESPVDRPFEHELSSKVEGPNNITFRIVNEKPKSKCDLYA